MRRARKRALIAHVRPPLSGCFAWNGGLCFAPRCSFALLGKAALLRFAFAELCFAWRTRFPPTICLLGMGSFGGFPTFAIFLRAPRLGKAFFSVSLSRIRFAFFGALLSSLLGPNFGKEARRKSKAMEAFSNSKSRCNANFKQQIVLLSEKSFLLRFAPASASAPQTASPARLGAPKCFSPPARGPPNGIGLAWFS